MSIGSLGDVVFEVSSDKVHTFQDLQIQRKANYAEHAIHGKKGLLEFTGFAPLTATMKIDLLAALGVVPKDELDALVEILTNHEAVPFILNGEPQGDNLWVLESMAESYPVINNKGELISVSVTLNLKEYVEAEDGG